jgi:hypothetical protein
MTTLTPEIQEKLAAQPSFASWMQANLTDDEQRAFHFGGGGRMGDALEAEITAGNLSVELVENSNNTLTEEHTWSGDSKREFLKDSELASAYEVFESYRSYLKSL